jgi:hypothetical protein
LLGKFAGVAIAQSGRLSPGLILRKAARLVSRPMELNSGAPRFRRRLSRRCFDIDAVAIILSLDTGTV